LARQTLIVNRESAVPGYLPYTARTGATLARLAQMKPKVLAAMHGSTFVGDGQRALADAATMMREVLG
jgi:hypothetical protein